MHNESEAAKVLVQFNDGLPELFDGFEDKEAVIYVEGRIKAEGHSFGGGILTNESSFDRVEVSIFIFWEMREVNRF